MKTDKRSVSKLVEQGLVVVEKVEGSYYQYEFRAQAIHEYPLPEYQYIGGQNVQHNNTIYNTIFNKKENKKENNYYRSAPYEVSPEVLAFEERKKKNQENNKNICVYQFFFVILQPITCACLCAGARFIKV